MYAGAFSSVLLSLPFLLSTRVFASVLFLIFFTLFLFILLFRYINVCSCNTFIVLRLYPMRSAFSSVREYRICVLA